MRQDYQTVNTLTWAQKKNYLLKICQDTDLENLLIDCMNISQFNDFIKQWQKELYVYAFLAIYQSKNYDELEYHLIMMNYFFDCQSYQQLKKELFQKISQQRITLDEYCVIRHLIPFTKQSFSQIMHVLHHIYHVDSEECAKICLLEDQPHLASYYLKQLNQCDNQQLLDLLCSYSLLEYVSLMKYYKKKTNHLAWVMSQ